MSPDFDFPTTSAANENNDPFLRADSGLFKLRRQRDDLLRMEPERFTLENWHKRNEAIKKLDEVIALYESYL